MKALLIAGKTLLELVRRPKTLAISLLIPVAFMVIFGLAFGQDAPGTHDVAVRNDDAGPHGDAFVQRLMGLEHADGTPRFDVTLVETTAAAGLSDGDNVLLVEVPRGFSGAINTGRTATVTLHSDPAQVAAETARQVTEGVLRAYVADQGNAPTVAFERQVVGAPDRTAFDFIAPGLMVFAILNLVPAAAAVLAREVETGTLDRIRCTPTGAGALLGGVALAQLALAAVSLLLMIVAAALMGFQNQGSFVATYVIAMLAAVSVVGVGMVVAALSDKQDDAANIGVAFAVPASFLSGAFFPVPGVDLLRVGGQTIGLYDVLPTTHATQAMRSVMTFGDGLGDVWGRLLALAVLAVVWFAVGVWLFTMRRMRAA